MAFPRTPGGLFPLTTAPTGRNAGGQYPLPAVLSDAIRSLAPTAYWKLDEASGNLADTMSGGYTATVTGSPTGVAAPSPIGRGVTWSGSGQYATSSGSVPTPTASVSVLALVSLTSSGSIRAIAARAGTNQYSWTLRIGSGNTPVFIAHQSSGTAHGTATASTTCNDGAWHVLLGSFDGTTVRVHHNGLETASTSLSGSWHPASTAGISIAHSFGSNLYSGTSGHLALFNDQRLGNDVARWLTALARGG